MKEYLFNLQLFAEEAGEAAGGTGEQAAQEQQEGAAQAAQQQEAKYTDEDVNKLLDRKFAEWQKKQEKKVSEAERLGKMTAEEKAAERLKTLEDKLAGYEKEAAKTEMTKQARAILQDKGIHAEDALLSNLIAENADDTKAAVESFVKLFQAAVEKAVKEKVKGEVPKTGTSSGITKEQIMNIQNRAERQQAIRDNINLFN